MVTANPPSARKSELLFYATQLENDVNGNIIYIGQAEAGSSLADPVWRITKLGYDGNGFVDSVTYASGNINFDKVWNDRAGYVYS